MAWHDGLPDVGEEEAGGGVRAGVGRVERVHVAEIVFSAALDAGLLLVHVVEDGYQVAAEAALHGGLAKRALLGFGEAIGAGVCDGRNGGKEGGLFN